MPQTDEIITGQIAEAAEYALAYQWKLLALVARKLPYHVDADSRPAQVRSPLSRLCIELVDRGMLAGCVVAAKSAGCVFRMCEYDGFVPHLIRTQTVETITTVLLSCGGCFHFHDRSGVGSAADIAIQCEKFEVVRLMSSVGIIAREHLEKLVASYRLIANAAETDRIGKEVGVVWKYLK